MKTKILVYALPVLVLATIHLAEAQQAKKAPRIGYLGGSPPLSERREAFLQGPREFGYIEEKNILIEWRSGEGKSEDVPALAAELVRLKVEVIVTEGSNATSRANEATSTIPIVMFNQIYSFDIDSLIQSIPKPEKMTRKDFDPARLKNYS